jgi:outer membrane protein assembly factor BamB
MVQALALDGATGSVLWQRTIPGSYVPTLSLLAGDTLFLGVVDTATPPVQRVVALRPSDGAQLWNLQVAATVPSPPRLLAGPSILYVEPSGAGEQARRLTDGKLLWTNNSIQSLLAAGPDAVYDLSPFGSVTAYNAQTGAQLWQYGNNYHFDATSAFSGDTLYVTARHSGPISDASGKVINPESLYALDAATGRPRWTYAMHSSSPSQLAVGPDTVYIDADDGIHALRASDGSLLWRSAPQIGWTFAPIAPIVGFTLYFTSLQILPPEKLVLLSGQRAQTYLYAVNATDGTTDWGVPVGFVLSLGGFDD